MTSARSGALSGEESIVWEEDPAGLPYVREYVDWGARTRRRGVWWHGPGRRVGYSVLRRDAPRDDDTGMFCRRVFWVSDHDRCNDPEGVYRTTCPSQGVDPLTVAPGVPGRVTSRAWNCAGFDGRPHGGEHGCALCGAGPAAQSGAAR